VLGGWTRTGRPYHVRIGTRLSPGRRSAATRVFETGRPARVDDPEEASFAGAELPSGARPRSVAAPIIVEGRVWGVVHVGTTSDGSLPSDTEDRLLGFTELVATAISNAQSRAELEASRSRIVATADATRRRMERDLHDGAQQQLLSLALELRAAQASVPARLGEHRAELSHIAEGLTNVLDSLREIALGLHPAILADGGLGPALKTLARRSPIEVKIDVRVEGRLPEAVEVAAYYVVSEALTNVVKHARASLVRVGVELSEGVLCVAVGDDGLGGADPERGSGLVGLRDRAEAIGGRILLDSRPGAGTALTAELPLGDDSG
jgi:signal transduction histidine kinase